MHKIVSAATVGSVGDLGRISRALADKGYNIAAVGGGEAPVHSREVGIISFAFHDDEGDNGDIVATIAAVDLGGGRKPVSVEEHPALVVELQDTVGELARAAEIIGGNGHNIMGVLLVDIFDGVAHVGLGFEGVGERDQVHQELEGEGFTVIDDHDDHDHSPS